ncbi:bacterio-opsin activator [Metallosphaera tengchongensis]|uniref:Bacterio-opsin activator n=1 Tax=Metallosphaera tengchongensis TaxID=1532350 RepID=A0A6N0NQP5_9CREN|nr:helix-turn-helix domain-containing protein [Metallosphaera tengchongensis]QKQ99011.1 bacterio-opsin activator [Metallosphaera tengchongensis]
MQLKKVTITLKHEDCWTSDIEDRTVTLNLEVYPEKGYLRSWLLAPSGKFGREFRGHNSVKKVNRVLEAKEYSLIDFLNIYEGSVAGILYNMEVLILGNYNVAGEETWSFVTGKTTLNEVRGMLSSIGEVSAFLVEDYLPKFPFLTDMERRAFSLALNRGYLEYPREVEAEDLARILGVSKVTFLYHWRNAQRKIMKFFAEHYRP